MLEIAKIIDRKLQYPCIHNFTSYQRYLRHNVYHDDDLSSHTCAEWTEITQPLASVPDNEYTNDLANGTIENHAHLFKVTTPINVDAFQQLLEQHPNFPFVDSVLNGL